MEAVGLIETKGFVGLVEAANAMVLVAEVDLVHYEKIGDGLVTVVLRGSLEEVRRAVRTGMAAAQRVGELVSAQVLPRVHPKVEAVLPLGRRSGGASGIRSAGPKPPRVRGGAEV